MGRLFLLFTVLPILDLWLLLRIGGRLGFWPTIALVLLTGAVGAALAKAEGLRVLREWQRAAREGRMPEEGVFSGLLVLAGGVLLVAPGFITDLVGLGLLFPPTRRIVAAALRRWLERKIQSGQVRVVRMGPRFDERPLDPSEPIDVTPPRRDGP